MRSVPGWRSTYGAMGAPQKTFSAALAEARLDEHAQSGATPLIAPPCDDRRGVVEALAAA